MTLTCPNHPVLVTLFSNSIFANDLSNVQNYQEKNASEIKLVSDLNAITLRKPVLVLEFDTIVTKTTNYKKTIEEVITEDNKIIESEIKNIAASDIEKVIKEDNLIIESNITNGLLCLNHKIIFSTTPFLTLTILDNRYYRK